ncbi:unnamed protein product, partial [Amoebophrya sp. A25]
EQARTEDDLRVRRKSTPISASKSCSVREQREAEHQGEDERDGPTTGEGVKSVGPRLRLELSDLGLTRESSSTVISRPASASSKRGLRSLDHAAAASAGEALTYNE